MGCNDRWDDEPDPEYEAAVKEGRALEDELEGAPCAGFTVREVYEILGLGDRFHHSYGSTDWIQRRADLKAIKEAASERKKLRKEGGDTMAKKQKATTKRGPKHCGNCGKQGHNVRTCSAAQTTAPQA